MNVLKIAHGDEVRRVTPLPQNFSELVNLAQEYFNMPVSGFTYFDESNEKITLDCESDFQEVQQFCISQGKKMLKLEVLVESDVSLINSIPITDSYYPAVPDEQLNAMKNKAQNTELATNETGSDPIPKPTHSVSCGVHVEMEDQSNGVQVESSEAASETVVIEVAENACSAAPEQREMACGVAPEVEETGVDAPMLIECEVNTNAVEVQDMSTFASGPSYSDVNIQCDMPEDDPGLTPEVIRQSIQMELSRLLPDLQRSLMPMVVQSQVQVVHPNTMCHFCKVSPIRGDRYFCTKCEIDICPLCEDQHGHNLVKYKRPVAQESPIMQPEKPKIEEQKSVDQMTVVEKVNYVEQALGFEDRQKIVEALNRSSFNVQAAIELLLAV